MHKRETLACLSKAPAMTRPVLVVEPDPSLRKLLMESLVALNCEVTEAFSNDLVEKLQTDQPYRAVFWSSTLLERNEYAQLRLQRPEGEPWILMAPPETVQEVPNHYSCLLVQPFRSVDVESALLGGDFDNEDPVLAFMREREREFGQFRRKESQLREAHKQLKELERMKNTFLSLVSHELRTPLTIISGNLHVLRKLASKWNNEIATECLGSAHEGTTRLSKLVDELLRFTVAAPQQRDQWDLGLTLKRVVGELRTLADDRGLTISLETERLSVEGDPAGLPDAILQLIENALLYNKPGGKVEVKGRRSKNGRWVEVVVEDDGPGIDSDELKKVFRPFYQVADVNTRKVEGLGIGLSLARRTIESHGGRLLLKSRVQQGTRATITLPVRSEVSLPFPDTNAVPPPPDQADPKALRDYAQEMYELLEAERIRRRHAEEQKKVLEQTFIETLVSLIRMVDPRVSGGTSQGERVLDYARAVARHLDPTLLSRQEFMYGLLLYDIGKIGVTESVLTKTGDLTDQERRAAQAHAQIGADLLTSVGVLQPAIDAVRYHHERWDGSGYPDGLKGNDIPILARIIAVVDSFDAMTVDRPYREAFTLEKARDQIEQGAGVAFDPEVVAAFKRAWDEIQAVSTKAASTETQEEPGSTPESGRELPQGETTSKP